MTTTNNYDQSSTGTNIECSLFYDTMRSQMDFDENIKIIQHSGYRTFTIGYYIDNGNVKDHDDISFTLKGNENDIENALLAEGYDRDEYKAMIEGEPFDILESAYGERITLLNFEDFNKVYAPLEAVPSKKLEKIITRGYSQGDYAEVYYCPDDLKEAWGNEPDKSSVKKMIDHYFWDSPINAAVTVNDDEFNYWDQPDYDEYEWEREKFLKFVAEKSGIAFETLNNLMPKDPSW